MVLIYLIILMLSIQSNKGEESDFSIHLTTFDVLSPPETIEKINSCTFIQSANNKTLTCRGNNCKKFMLYRKKSVERLKIIDTGIAALNVNDLNNCLSVSHLEIESNADLCLLEAGCFRNMSNLKNLSISGNYKLTLLDENVFEGLVNLTELHLSKNGFIHISDITPSLSPTYLPSLLKLNLNNNNFKVINKSDFEPMIGTPLRNVLVVSCFINYIHPRSFFPLKNLTLLNLGYNQFNTTVLKKLIDEIKELGIPLRKLYLEYSEDIFQSIDLWESIAATNITHLKLRNNKIDSINEQMFPQMPNILYLDLSLCSLFDIRNDSFKNLPNLQFLLLNENSLQSVISLTPFNQLQRLDLSKNSGDQIIRSLFRIDNFAFSDMHNLLELNLGFNLITTIKNVTFLGLINLNYLDLQNASINFINNGTFSHLKKLEFLNLNNNLFIDPLNIATFFGLDNLKTLLLGGCGINYIDDVNLFSSLKNLRYLSLKGNTIYTISQSNFLTLQNLNSLDLSTNKLVEWNYPIFLNLQIRKLNLNQNKIKTITQTMVEDFQNLDILVLDCNPFICNCMLNPAAFWLSSHNFSFKYIKNGGLYAKCVFPEQSNYIIYNYLLNNATSDKECHNDVSVGKIIIILVPSAIVLLILVLAYIYRLHLCHWILLTRIALNKYVRKRKQIDGTEYKYDAFVSYSNEDREFVVKLVYELENNPPHFKLCVYERDFQIGTAISEAVMHSVAASRRTLLIISEAFVRSQWCRWEAKLAEHHQLFFCDSDVQASQRTLLIILLSKKCRVKLTPTLKHLIKTRIYLQWTDRCEEQQIFWDRLRKYLSLDSDLTISCEDETTIANAT